MNSCKQKAVSENRPSLWCNFSEADRLQLTAFTLLEVVAAVGIFAIGMVAVIGLFTPVAKSVTDLADAEAATRVTDLLNAQMQAQETADAAAGTPFATLVSRLFVSTGKSNQLTNDDAKTNYNVATD